MTTCNDPIQRNPSSEHLAPTANLIHPGSSAQMRAMQRIARAFVGAPDTVLQELVDTAIALCEAESAGILIEVEQDKPSRADVSWWKCAAASGQYAHARDTSHLFRLTGISLEPGRAQPIPASHRFFELIGLRSSAVTRGVLLPWQAGDTRGLLWIAFHAPASAVEPRDSTSSILEPLADFAAVAVRHQQQQHTLMEQVAASAVADMANDLAHQINNPLQAMTNVAYLAAEGQSNGDARTLGRTLSSELKRLSALVNKLLALPGRTAL